MDLNPLTLDLPPMSAVVAERVRSGELSYTDGVSAGMYVPLGEGDVVGPRALERFAQLLRV